MSPDSTLNPLSTLQEAPGQHSLTATDILYPTRVQHHPLQSFFNPSAQESQSI